MTLALALYAAVVTVAAIALLLLFLKARGLLNELAAPRDEEAGDALVDVIAAHLTDRREEWREAPNMIECAGVSICLSPFGAAYRGCPIALSADQALRIERALHLGNARRLMADLAEPK